MSKMFRSAHVKNVEPNVTLKGAKGYYDKFASLYQRIVLLEGSILNIDQGDETIADSLKNLVHEGYLEVDANRYIVKKPFSGSPSGIAASVLGKRGPKKPNGYQLWQFADGKTIEEAGERPIKKQQNK
ncbi:DUF4357 domain-containing protein [Lysinibacillus sp. BW-2-10]|uniref:DUF4357 domain-containing protein n=1 Tax=Lysinibacillus sp. BW-2-10 TaxID=2590030 RepID=UPI00117C2FB7|nr:DUF4357 domain-containing protein [Lysinibacillus sp. BW-2-10]TSI05292.1 hypothetical protein FJQ64_13390 [Lysinibacillus sp. BW-2-10]